MVSVCRDRIAVDVEAEPVGLGELPEPAVETSGHPPRHEPSSILDDPGEVDVTLDHLGADPRRGQLGLPPSRARGADVAQRTDETTRVARRADRRAEIHEPLVVVAGVFRGDRGRGELGEAASARRAGRVVERVDAREDPRDVPVDDRQAMPERDRTDRARGVGADAGQRRDVVGLVWKAAAVPLDDRARGLVQRPGARVVTQSRPQREHLVERSRRERRDRRKPREPPLPVRQHGLQARLLRHDLADPDRVRIAHPPPGQIAPVAAVVGED